MLVLGLIAGAALAAPAAVLEVRGSGREIALPIPGDAFGYSYRQSIYDAPVREELRVVGDGIRIDRAVSPDIRALEYFRWPGNAEQVDGGLAWRAPENGSHGLDLVIARDGQQAIDTGARRLALRDVFGDDARVTVRPARRPLLVWLWGLLP